MTLEQITDLIQVATKRVNENGVASEMRRFDIDARELTLTLTPLLGIEGTAVFVSGIHLGLILAESADAGAEAA